MDNQILAHLHGSGAASLREIQEAVDADIGTVFARCRELEREQQITRVRPFTYECPDPPPTEFTDHFTSQTTNDDDATDFSTQDPVTTVSHDQDSTENEFIWGEDR